MENLDRRFRWFRLRLLDWNRKFRYFYFRGLTSREINIGSSKSTDFDRICFILETTVKGVEDWEGMPGGSCLRLLREIYRVSGLDEHYFTFQEAVKWQESDEGQLEIRALQCIPGLTLEILETCDPTTRAKYLLAAKQIFEDTYQIALSKMRGGQDIKLAEAHVGEPNFGKVVSQNNAIP